MNALRTMEDAVNMPPVPTYLTASIAPAILDTLVMVSPVQVRLNMLANKYQQNTIYL